MDGSVTAQAVADRLWALDGGWVDRERTVDRFYAGDPEREVTGIAVAWMSYSGALRRAVNLGCNLFVTHEPTYFSARDDEEAIFRFPGVRAKRQWIESSGLTILRCHDLWDRLREIGIPDSWARYLGFEDPIAGAGYFRLFDVTGHTARSLARQIAARTASLGQPGVQLIGPSDAPVSRLALGTGAITPLTSFLDEFSADVVLCSDDGFVYWHDGALAIDLGLPAIVVNHAVSELAGMEELARFLAAAFPQVPVHHIPQSCMFELIGSK